MAIDPQKYDVAVIDGIEAILRDGLQGQIELFGLSYDRAGINRVVQLIVTGKPQRQPQ